MLDPKQCVLFSGGAAGAVCLVFGTAEYGIALTAQGVDVGALFGLRGGKDGPAAV